QVYVKQLNAQGGVYGRKLVLIREDDLCKPEAAIAAVKKLIYEHKVFAILGGACSNSTLAARPEIEKAGVPFHVFAAVADGIVEPPAPNIYTTQLTGSIESPGAGAWAGDRGAQTVATARPHGASGRGPSGPT